MASIDGLRRYLKRPASAGRSRVLELSLACGSVAASSSLPLLAQLASQRGLQGHLDTGFSTGAPRAWAPPVGEPASRSEVHGA